MTRHPGQHSRSKPPPPPQEDRRQVNVLKGVPLMGGLGLVFHDRRSYRERRSKRRSLPQAVPCALLQHREGHPAPGFFRTLSSGWGQTAIGAWIKRCLNHSWRFKPRRPAGPP